MVDPQIVTRTLEGGDAYGLFTDILDGGGAGISGGGPGTLPTGISVVVVWGRLLNTDGTPAVGTIEWTASTAVKYPGLDVTLLAKPVPATLDAFGFFFITLPATDDPAGDPMGWCYSVNEKVPNGRKRILRLNRADEMVDYSDLLDVLPGNGVPTTPVGTTYTILLVDGGTP